MENPINPMIEIASKICEDNGYPIRRGSPICHTWRKKHDDNCVGCGQAKGCEYLHRVIDLMMTTLMAKKDTPEEIMGCKRWFDEEITKLFKKEGNGKQQGNSNKERAK